MAKWMGDIGDGCQLCHAPWKTYFIDARTRLGWALVCPACHKAYGHGLGTGKGQKYEVATKIKVAG